MIESKLKTEPLEINTNGPRGKKCKVCSDKAVNQNFGVLSCESCKAFFRRNAIRFTPLKCTNGSELCPVSSSTRKQCPSCRLKKCLLVGMRSELIQIRKNNSKLNPGKRKSTKRSVIAEDDVNQKHFNWTSNDSDSSGRFSQYNDPEEHISFSKNANINQNIGSFIIPSKMWVNPTNISSIVPIDSNILISTRNNTRGDAGHFGIPYNHYWDNVDTTFISCASYISESLNRNGYDLRVPTIKIETNQSLLQPIAFFPTMRSSVCDVTDVFPVDSANSNINILTLPHNQSWPNRSTQEWKTQPILEIPNTDPIPFHERDSHQRYPTNSIPPHCSSSAEILYNSISSVCPWHGNSVNVDCNRFSIDSHSDAFCTNNLYHCGSPLPEIHCAASDNYERFKGQSKLFSFDDEKDNNASRFQDLSSYNESRYCFNSVSDSSIGSLSSKCSPDHDLIIHISDIWEKTLGKLVLFPNPRNIQIDINLNRKTFGISNSEESFDSSLNWRIEFLRLAEIFTLQLRLFLKEVSELPIWEKELTEKMKDELEKHLDNGQKTSVLLLMPILFANFIYPSYSNDDTFNSDQDFDESIYDASTSEPSDGVIVNFSVKNVDKEVRYCNDFKCQVDLNLLSNLIVELDNEKYSSLQYLAKYCLGLSNFLCPSSALCGLFSLLKVVVMQSNCGDFFNRSVLPLSENGDSKSNLIDYLKSMFLLSCDLFHRDSTLLRLQSLEQFLFWGKSQFDSQWIDFVRDTLILHADSAGKIGSSFEL